MDSPGQPVNNGCIMSYDLFQFWGLKTTNSYQKACLPNYLQEFKNVGVSPLERDKLMMLVSFGNYRIFQGFFSPLSHNRHKRSGAFAASILSLLLLFKHFYATPKVFGNAVVIDRFTFFQVGLK